MPKRSLSSLLLAATLAAPLAGFAQSAPRYVDIESYFTRDAQYEAWFGLVSQLRRNFDDICGDTFCEGDYSNIQSLDYRCSVEQASGTLGRCIWLFAGSYADVNADTGGFDVTRQFWRCRTPLAPHTQVDGFLAALAGDDPLYATLPGTQTTIYDGLADCL